MSKTDNAKTSPVRSLASGASPTRSAASGASGGKAGDTLSIQPLGDRVLLKPLSAEETARRSAAGIIIPDTVDKEKPMQGRIIAVGEGRYSDDGKLIPMRVKVGDRVVFSKYSPDEIKIEGEEYYILAESSVLAVIS